MRASKMNVSKYLERKRKKERERKYRGTSKWMQASI